MPSAPAPSGDLYASLADSLNDQIDAKDRPDAIPEHDGAIYRRIFRGLEVHGFPKSLEIGDVSISQQVGPILTHRTELRQRAGFPLIFDKSMERRVEVGHGHWLTLCQIRFPEAPSDLSSMRLPREKAETALGYVAAIVDERIAQAPLAEDLILTLGDEPVAALGVAENVRHFMPYQVTQAELDAFEQLAEGSAADLGLAARSYLRGAQAGPSQDGVVFLWIAIEALVGDKHPKAIEGRLEEAGWEMAHQRLSVRQIFEIRSQLVHAEKKAKSVKPEDLRAAYYDAEAITRVLLRHALGVESTWPAPPEANMFDPPWQQVIAEAWQPPPAVIWHEPPLPAIPTDELPGLSWQPIHPPSPLPAEITIDGGSLQEQHRLRRWIGMALAFFDSSDPISFSIRRLEESDGTVDADQITVASSLIRDRDPNSEIRLGLRVLSLVASQLLYRAGVPTTDVSGVLTHGVLAGWSGHRVFVVENDLDERFFTHKPLTADSNLRTIGEHLGAMVAGGRRSKEIIETWSNEIGVPDEIPLKLDGLVESGSRVGSGRQMLDQLVADYRAAETAEG